MNIKQKLKGGAVHKMLEGQSVCGLLWLSGGRAKETTDEVTCKHCIRMAGGRVTTP